MFTPRSSLARSTGPPQGPLLGLKRIPDSGFDLCAPQQHSLIHNNQCLLPEPAGIDPAPRAEAIVRVRRRGGMWRLLAKEWRQSLRV